MFARMLLAAACLAVLAFAPAPFPKPPKDDLKKMAGTWTVLAYERGGKAMRISTATMKVKIAGDKWEFITETLAGKRVTATYAVKVDVKAKPRGMNMKGQHGELLGIYRLDGDQFELLFHTFGATNRPADFDKGGPQAYRLVMKREK